MKQWGGLAKSQENPVLHFSVNTEEILNMEKDLRFLIQDLSKVVKVCLVINIIPNIIRQLEIFERKTKENIAKLKHRVTQKENELRGVWLSVEKRERAIEKTLETLRKKNNVSTDVQKLEDFLHKQKVSESKTTFFSSGVANVNTPMNFQQISLNEYPVTGQRKGSVRNTHQYAEENFFNLCKMIDYLNIKETERKSTRIKKTKEMRENDVFDEEVAHLMDA